MGPKTENSDFLAVSGDEHCRMGDLYTEMEERESEKKEIRPFRDL